MTAAVATAEPWYIRNPAAYQANRSRASARQALTIETATRRNAEWTSTELELVMEDAPLVDIALTLGRTVSAVAARRSLILRAARANIQL